MKYFKGKVGLGAKVVPRKSAIFQQKWRSIRKPAKNQQKKNLKSRGNKISPPLIVSAPSNVQNFDDNMGENLYGKHVSE